MIALIIVFALDIIGSFITAKMEVKREITTERQLRKIEDLLLSSPQYSPFSEFEGHEHGKQSDDSGI